MDETETVICGAGIAGIAVAHYLSVKYGRKDIILIDRLAPMSLTTSKSGENYRDYWPHAGMTEFVSHSLDLMQELNSGEGGNALGMREIGYDFVSEKRQDIFPSSYGPESEEEGYLRRIVDNATLRREKPYLAESVSQLVQVKRAGVVDVYALGSSMLAKARSAGVVFRQAYIENIKHSPDSGYSLSMAVDSGQNSILRCAELVLAAGPFTGRLAKMLGIDLPLENYLQRKFVIPDPHKTIPRDMPFTIYADSQHLNWSEDEKSVIENDGEFAHLLEEFPAGLHIKPEGGDGIKMGWAFNREAETARWEVADDREFVDITMRGASRFIPSLARYIGKIPTPVVQFSGYYTRTSENWPMIGPLPLPGLYCSAALSGFGTMSACAAGELCAQWMNGISLPDYAKYFHPARYDDTEIMQEINSLSSDGQL